ncbi:hypothetical protein ACK3SF_00705 [Candidatus Nanosalina sp. VS9-1]|uniref:hypothetical protein n=1 Tax=Candidatus Nanosalina sp. VS9-1 TaxID=3388566 RepID=UPI0039E1F3DC
MFVLAQIGVLKLRTGSGIEEVPVFDTSDVSQDFLRVQTAAGTGALALVDPEQADIPELRVMTSSGVRSVKKSLSSYEFYDGFEASSVDSSWSTEEMTGQTSYEVSSNRAFSGSQSVRIYMDDDEMSGDDENAALRRYFDQPRERRFSVMVYDEGTSEQWIASVSNSNVSSGLQALEWGQSSDYTYRDGGSFNSTGKSRTTGWRKFEFVADGTETRFLIDGDVVHTSTAYGTFDSITIGSFWGVNDWGYYDDVKVERL